MSIQVKVMNQAESTPFVTLDKNKPHIQLQTKGKYVSEKLSIELIGGDQTDASAVASDTLLGKTAYNGDGKFTGTIATFDGETDASFDTCPVTTSQATSAGFTWTEIPDLCFFLNESGTSVAYQIDEGMTWAEFVNSAYNTGGFSIDTEDAHPPYKYVILKGSSTVSGLYKYAEAADVLEDCSQFFT